MNVCWKISLLWICIKQSLLINSNSFSSKTNSLLCFISKLICELGFNILFFNYRTYIINSEIDMENLILEASDPVEFDQNAVQEISINGELGIF